MNGSKFKVLTAIAGVLALGEFGSAVMIWLENYGGRRADAVFAVAFGVFFLLATWLLRSRRVTAGAVFAGALCLFEVISFSGWARHSALDWTYQITFALVSLAGLIAAVAVLAGRLRRRAAA